MNITFITTLVFVALLVSCGNTVPPVNDNATNTTTVAGARPFELPTPDSLAFVGEIQCETGKRYKYCGYSSYLRDSVLCHAVPGFVRFALNTKAPYCGIEINELSSSGAIYSTIHIGGLSFQSGIYFPIRGREKRQINEISAIYYDSNGGCSDKNQYVLDTTHQSFVKVVSYDSVSKEIKLRFDLYFQLEKINVPGDYPKYLHFGDGVVLAKTAN